MTDEYRIDGWHLTKRVSISHLLTTLVIIVSFITWMVRQEAQIEANQKQTESEFKNVNERIDHIERSMDGHYLEIIRRLEKVDDRLAEHMGNVQSKQ